IADLGVCPYALSAEGCYLQICHLSALLGGVLEKGLVRSEALEKPLARVETVRADDEAPPQCTLHGTLNNTRSGGTCRTPSYRSYVHTYWKDAGANHWRAR